YGALATAAGLDVWQAMVLSAVMFTGGSQFAFVGVISGGGSAIGAALAALLLGGRNTLFGLTLATVRSRGGWRGALRAPLAVGTRTAPLRGVRDTLYGTSLAPGLPRGGWRGALRAQLTIDESAALAASGTSAEAKRTGFWAAGVWVYVFWNLFSLLGALAGQY